MRPIVFAYNFPHKKTQDFLQRLVLLQQPPIAVLAANRVEIKSPPQNLRVKPRSADLVHPRDICRRFGIPYFVVEHEGASCMSLLKEFRPELGLIAGARILPPPVIDAFSLGVVNFHPGLIPETRGLDAVQWAIYHDLPLGVTAHLIDQRVDAGRIVQRREIPEYFDDTLVELSLRLYETQIDMLLPVLNRLDRGSADEFENVGKGEYRSSFPAELVPQMLERFTARQRRLASAA